ISLPADIVEEVLRIDGLDNIDIAGSITMSPSVEEKYTKEAYKEKVSNYLVGPGFNEIMTNSITNSFFYNEEELQESVKMINNLSAELDTMRPSMVETGLQSIAYNLNHKNNNLKFFEFGKTYKTTGVGKYEEQEHLCLYISGNANEAGWRSKSSKADFYVLKGIVANVLQLLGLGIEKFEHFENEKLINGLQQVINNEVIVQMGEVNQKTLAMFDIKQPVLFADLNWDILSQEAGNNKIKFKVIPKFPAVHRDLAIIVPSVLKYEEIEKVVQKTRLTNLQEVKLFDIFESEKLGAGKKSMAISFTFLNEEKTLTDKEIDGWMNMIMNTLEKELHAEIRK
ncbi:MAG: phenylalanine--tRNA ligase subunit beta, partial [Bacteroidota bacterium]|nr:phenylalanine--tRNA ligase subunit beta [Bacteroidota bacterium]